MVLADFMKLPPVVRRKCFDELSLTDQMTFLLKEDPLVLILGGYPSESQLLAMAECSCSQQFH